MASNWAIVIGINEYRFLQPLKYAKRDAELMRDFLAQAAKFDRIFLFTDDSPPIGDKSTDPIRNNLLRVFRQIFASPFMKDGDNFWFFFSGHGIRHNEQDYLMPSDGDPEDIESTGISTNTITNYLRSCGADNVVLILDACRSGGKKSGEGIGRQTEEQARQTGVISIFSCSPDQYSYELEAIGQGAFTYTLLEGLSIRGQCATVERLNQYLQSQVPQLVQQHLGRARQTPYTIAEPINRSHLILMPQYATLGDIATLKNDAYRAQTKKDWDLAQRLWIRVLAAASGQDIEAIEALQEIGIQRHTGAIPPQPQSPQLSQAADPAKAFNILSTQRVENTTPGNIEAVNEEPDDSGYLQEYHNARNLFLQGRYEEAASAVRQLEEAHPDDLKIPALRKRIYSHLQQSKALLLNNSPSSRTRRQFLKWTIPAGIGVIGVGIAGQFLGEQAKQSPPSEPSSVTPNTRSSVPVSSSPSQVDYSRLEELLEAKQWKEADQETAALMLKVANRIEQGYLDDDSVKNFPCDVLSQIDRLWVDNSGGKFGFSIQKNIYVEDCGGKPDGQQDAKAFDCFSETVGWQEGGGWNSSSDSSDTRVLIGHFPGLLGREAMCAGWGDKAWCSWAFSSLVQKLGSCDIL